MTSYGISSSVCVQPGSAPVPITDGQPQSWVIMPTPTSRVVNRYRHRQSIWFGAILIVLGCLSITCNIVQLHMRARIAVLGHGIWCGVMIIVTGSFGISAGRRKLRCLIVTFMILCIISPVMCIVPFVISLLSGVPCFRQQEYLYHDCDGVREAINLLLAITSALAALISICGSSLGCRALDCCNPAEDQPYGIPMMVISQPATQAAPGTDLGVYRYQLIPGQPNAPIQPVPVVVPAPAGSESLPDNRDLAMACANSPNEPLLPPEYDYGTDHVDEKKMLQNY